MRPHVVSFSFHFLVLVWLPAEGRNWKFRREGGLKKPGGGKNTASVLDALVVLPTCISSAKCVKCLQMTTDPNSGSNLDGNVKGSVVDIQHTEDFKEGTFGEGTSRMAYDASRGAGGVVVSAELEHVKAVADPLLFECFGKSHYNE